MSKKILSVFLAVSLMLSLALVSAASFTASPSPLVFSQAVNSTTFTIANQNAITPVTVAFGSLSIAGESYTVSFNALVGTNPIANLSSSTFTLSPSSAIDYSKFILGKTYAGNLFINNTANPSDSQTIAVNINKAYCKSGNVGSNLSKPSVEDKTSGRDDFDWSPLDNIKLDVDVSNDADVSQKVAVKIELADSAGKLIELSGDKELEDTVRISDGNDETFSFEFQIPGDIKEGSYQLFAKAYVDGKESTQCIDGDITPVTIEFQDDFGIDLNQLDIPGTLQCGDEAGISFDVYNFNLGDNEQMRARIVNKELGINLVSDSFELDEGDSNRVSFNFNIPADAAEKVYKFDLFIDYDYRESSDMYVSTDTTKSFSISVKGACASTPANLGTVVTATLDSDAVAGQQIVVKANVLNSGASSQTYTMLAAGYDSFAALNKIDPQSFTLAAGQSKDVLIYLNANSDASGDYTFSVKAVSGSTIKEQQLTLNVQGKSNSLSEIFSGLGSNWLIWVIVLVNIVLIILIIVIAVRIARK